MQAASLWRADTSADDALACADVRIERPAGLGIAAPFAKLLDPPHANAPVERGRYHVADLQRVPGRDDTTAVDPYPTSAHKSGRRRSRLDDPCMPQPLVDALSVHDATRRD